MTNYCDSLHHLTLFFIDSNEGEKVEMERNLAYELHKPCAKHKQPLYTTPIYEDMKQI